MKKAVTKNTKAIRKPNKMRRMRRGGSGGSGGTSKKVISGRNPVNGIRLSSLTRQVRTSEKKSVRKKGKRKRKKNLPRQSIFLPPARVIHQHAQNTRRRSCNEFAKPISRRSMRTPTRKQSTVGRFERVTPIMPLSGFKSPRVRREEKIARESAKKEQGQLPPQNQQLQDDNQREIKVARKLDFSNDSQEQQQPQVEGSKSPTLSQDPSPSPMEEGGGTITLNLLSPGSEEKARVDDSQFQMDNSAFLAPDSEDEFMRDMEMRVNKAKNFDLARCAFSGFVKNREPKEFVEVRLLMEMFRRECPQFIQPCGADNNAVPRDVKM